MRDSHIGVTVICVQISRGYTYHCDTGAHPRTLSETLLAQVDKLMVVKYKKRLISHDKILFLSTFSEEHICRYSHR